MLAPPSRHVAGGTYRWLRGLDQAPLPEARPPCVPCSPPTRQCRPGRPTRAGRPPRPPVRPPGPGRRTGRPRPGHPGQRNRTLNRTAFKVYRYVAGGLLDEETVTLVFTAAALAVGLSAAEVDRTLASARTAGLANPRTVPATPDPNSQEVRA